MIVLFILVFTQDFQLQQLERRISRMQGERSNEEKLQLEARITVKLHKSLNPLEFCCFSKVAYTCRLLCIENSIHCRCSHFAVDFVGSFFKWCYPKPNYGISDFGIAVAVISPDEIWLSRWKESCGGLLVTTDHCQQSFLGLLSTTQPNSIEGCTVSPGFKQFSFILNFLVYFFF